MPKDKPQYLVTFLPDYKKLGVFPTKKAAEDLVFDLTDGSQYIPEEFLIEEILTNPDWTELVYIDF